MWTARHGRAEADGRVVERCAQHGVRGKRACRKTPNSLGLPAIRQTSIAGWKRLGVGDLTAGEPSSVDLDVAAAVVAGSLAQAQLHRRVAGVRELAS